MGVSGFLSKVLETSGRSVDLRDYAEGKLESHKRSRRLKKYRIGVDLTSSIYKAAYGYGDMLGDERYLTNFGRAQLLDEQQQPVVQKNDEKIMEYIARCVEFVMKRLEMLRQDSKCDILVVFDGETPPIKKKETLRRRKIRREHALQRDAPVDPTQTDFRATEEARIKANRRAGAGKHFGPIVLGLIDSLKEANVAYMIAPYEADGQLTYMSRKGYIDLIISEDSDLIAHGAKAIIYNYISGNGFPDEGILLQFEDLGEVAGKFDLSDFSPEMMAILFVSVGCDYCEKLKGIGLGTAAKVVRQAFFEGSNSPLDSVLSQLYEKCWERGLTDDQKKEYESRFIAAVFIYQHPIVFDPVQGKQLIQGLGKIEGHSKLLKHKAYAKLCLNEEERIQVIGTVKGPEEARIAAITPSHFHNRSESGIDDMGQNQANASGRQTSTLRAKDDEQRQRSSKMKDSLDRRFGKSAHIPANEFVDSETLYTQSQEIGLLSQQNSSPSIESQNLSESPRYETQMDSEPFQLSSETGAKSKQKNQALREQSPNLLYSSTPDKTQSQRSEQSSIDAT